MRGIERIFIRRADEQEVCTLRLRVFLHERKISRRTPKLALRHRVCAGVIGQCVGVIQPAIRAEQHLRRGGFPENGRVRRSVRRDQFLPQDEMAVKIVCRIR